MTPYYDHAGVTVYHGNALDVLRSLPENSVHCCVTSPPYFGLRDYGVAGQLGLEATPELYVAHMVEVFREVRRVLRDDGTCWLNIGDSYASGGRGGSNHHNEKMGIKTAQAQALGRKVAPDGLKDKDLVGIPWMLAFALRDDGWYLRSEIIWSKPNPMPESVTDRPTKSHEQVFLLSKASRYFYDADAIREPHIYAHDPRNDGTRHTYASNAKHNQVDPDRQRTKTDAVSFHPDGRNRRTVWTVATMPYSEAHFATFPPKLVEPMVLAGCPTGGVVLDPFHGAGTTGMVAQHLGRRYIGIELKQAYIELSLKRLRQSGMELPL